MRRISVVIPCYRSGENIKNVTEETIGYLNLLTDYEYEIILVNDGSPDHTYSEIESLVLQYPCVTGVDLSKNFGQHNATLAGMRFATGDYIVGMDDDMQTHPSQIKILVDKLEEGYDIVYGKYYKRNHGFLRNVGSKFNDITVRFLIGKPKGLTACSFYIIRRFVREEIMKSQSAYTNLQGLFLRTTNRIANVNIQHSKRRDGKSGYSVRKLIKLWASFLNYSIKPIRMIIITGLLFTFCGILCFLLSVFLFHNQLHTILSAFAVFSGVIVQAIGMIGEYLARAFKIQSKEPQYVIREISSSNTIREVAHEENSYTWGR